MKDSGIKWIGKIPDGWNTIRIKNTSWLKGRIGWDGLKSSEYLDAGPYLITGTDFNDGGINWNTCVHISEERFAEDEALHIFENDLLITKDGTVGKLAIVRNCPEKVSLNSGVMLIRNNRQFKYVPKYLYYVLSSREFELWYELSQTGNSTIKHLYQEQFYNFEFSYPPLDVQKKIADFLDSKCTEIQAAIDNTKQTIEEYKKLKTAVITKAVTKGIRPNRKMKYSGIEWIGQIPQEWEVVKIRHIGQLQNGISKDGSSFGSGYPFVSYGDVYKNFALPEKVLGLIETSEEERNRYSVKKGDIFFTRTSETIEEVGFSSVCKQTIENATFAGFLIRLRPYFRQIDIDFAKYYFRSEHNRFYLVKEMNLVTRASLGQGLLKNMPVLYPSLTEQSEIAAYLDKKCSQIDTVITQKELFITEMEKYKQSLIYECVTGKRKVK